MSALLAEMTVDIANRSGRASFHGGDAQTATMIPTEEDQALNSDDRRARSGRRPTALLADDHARIIEAALELLAEDFDVVGQVTNGRAALEKALLLNPDVIVLDISMPGMDGIEVARELRRRSFGGKIVILTLHKDAEYVEVARAEGVNGYVFKNRMYKDLTRVLKLTLTGAICIPEQ